MSKQTGDLEGAESMKIMSERMRVLSLAILSGILTAAMALWLIVGSDEPEFDRFQEIALCMLDLPVGTSSVSATFTNTRPVEKFHVAIKTRGEDEALAISISGDEGVIANSSGIKAGLVGLGWNIQPGTYTVTLRQDVKGKGGLVIISGEKPAEYLTGWQIWSRTHVALLGLSGICALLLRKSMDKKKRASSLATFHILLLIFALNFIYLFFHESGHSLAEIAFGRFDLARADFWGIHGYPHSGGTMGATLKPWQHTVIGCAGPMLPTFAGFGLFLLWRLPKGRKFRSLRPMANLYFSAIVATLVLPEAVTGPAYILGLISAEGDVIGYVTKSGGPVWLVKGFLWSIFLIGAMILWRVVPEIWNAWRIRFLDTWKSVSDLPQA